LLVTTPAGDLQTTVSANVAVTLAQSGRRVILVHADMRRPHGHELFGIEHVPGLADVLEHRASLANALWQPEIPGPQIVPAGLLVDDIGTALHPSRLGEVVRRLSRAADIVVIDAPAALAGSDIATMVEVVDMVLLVGDTRRTTRAQVRAAAGRLAHVQQKLIGCVLVNFGRRTRLVTPPLSLITGREDHPSSMPRPNDRDDDQLEEGGADDSARWLLSRLIETLDATENGVDQINGQQGPTTKMKG
jgi:capsular exopolysaccharide synthesis family protein